MSDQDRRTRRSPFPAEALHLLLEACRSRGGYEALIVADELGFLVGASDAAGVDARELATEVILSAPQAHNEVTRVPFRVFDRTLYVAALGHGRTAPIVDAVFGARRILAA